MRRIDMLIVHCSATPPDMDIGVEEIRAWHKARGWSDIGYHFVIRRDGVTETGRPAQVVGAHARGHNKRSIGICLVGGIDDNWKPRDNFTYLQKLTLQYLLRWLVVTYRPSEIVGHGSIPGVHKACPCFDLEKFLAETGLDEFAAPKEVPA